MANALWHQGPSRVAPPPRSLGVEEEWCVSSSGVRVDYRRLHGAATRELARRDPGDPAAVRTPVGTALTVDGWEAETVTPPIPIDGDAVATIDYALAQARVDLTGRLAPIVDDLALSGWSTHLNISVPDRSVVRIARRLRVRCGAALPTLLGAQGAGVLVRPRRHRMEVCLDHLEPPARARALVALTGLVGMCTQEGLLADWRFIPEGNEPWGVSRERFGHHLPRSASEPDDLTRRIWERARRHARRAGLDTEPVDAFLAGRSQALAPQKSVSLPVLDLGARRRPFGTVTARWVTWQVVAWECGIPAVHALIPAAANDAFLADLDAGALDRALSRRVRRHMPKHPYDERSPQWARRVLSPPES